MYYLDLTLRDGTHLQDAILTAKEIDQQSKQARFNQNALDQIAKQGFANARFEVNAEEGLDFVEEFYTDDESESEQTQVVSKSKVKQGEGFVQDIQQGLQGSVWTN